MNRTSSRRQSDIAGSRRPGARLSVTRVSKPCPESSHGLETRVTLVSLTCICRHRIAFDLDENRIMIAGDFRHWFLEDLHGFYLVLHLLCHQNLIDEAA